MLISAMKHYGTRTVSVDATFHIGARGTAEPRGCSLVMWVHFDIKLKAPYNPSESCSCHLSVVGKNPDSVLGSKAMVAGDSSRDLSARKTPAQPCGADMTRHRTASSFRYPLFQETSSTTV